MKKHLTVYLIMAIALNTFAAGYRGTDYTDIINTVDWWRYDKKSPTKYFAGSKAYSDRRDDAYIGFEYEWGSTNSTSSGKIEFSRGSNKVDTVVYVHEDASGSFSVSPRSDFRDNQTTKIILDPNVTITTKGYALLLQGDRNRTKVGSIEVLGGTYNAGKEALIAGQVNTLTIDGASFTAGSKGKSAVLVYQGDLVITNSRERTDMVYQASAVGYNVGTGLYAGGDATIDGGNISFIASQGSISSLDNAITNNVTDLKAYASGVSGAFIKGTTDITGANYSFIGSKSGKAKIGGDNARVFVFGSHGATFIDESSGALTNSTFIGGAGGSAEVVKVEYWATNNTIRVSENNASSYAGGGSGLLKNKEGTMSLTDSKATGGIGGWATVDGDNGYADATGGNGIMGIGELTITGGKYTGGQGGIALARDGEAYAFGGSGIYFGGTELTINGGTFVGGKGGTADGASANAYGGAGIYALGDKLTINGGTFSGGLGGRVSGKTQLGQIGIHAYNSDVEINDTLDGTLIDGNILFNNVDAKSLDINGGEITGDIIVVGAGLATIAVQNEATYSGDFLLLEGSADVVLTNDAQGSFFSNVEIGSESAMNFIGSNQLVTAENANFSLYGTNSTLFFSQGAHLSKGSSINVGLGTVSSSTNNLVIGDNASVTVGYSSISDSNGVYTAKIGSLNANLILTNSTARINLSGVSSTAAGTVQISTGTVVTNGTNALAEMVNVNLGWLTAVTNIADVGGIQVEYAYNSLTNSSLSDLNNDLLVTVDGMITDTNQTSESAFLSLNGSGESGASMFRYTLSQLPDVSESSFQVNQQVNQQIAARGTEYRSMNGFASTKPTRGKNTQPVGAAGPDAEGNTMQGWIRAYGSFGNKDKTDHFSAYDSSSWGSVIGVDKSFENLLVGLAGGFSRTDLDAGSAYQADVETTFGSIYSTIGGERIFVDLAATYGFAKNKEQNGISLQGNEFDSDIYSVYVGGGMNFELGEKVSLTPEASLLSSFFTQESFDRVSNIGTGTVQEYDAQSFLGSVGLNLASQHQIDWLSQGLALIPEVRVHWLHEFNPDPDSFMYTIGGVTGPSAVRPRDEDLFRLGAGFDIWSWKFQSTKFEFDYDGLFSSTYSEHIFSGKITLQF